MNRLGSMMIELMAALAILVAGAVPLTYMYAREQKAMRTAYHRAVAMEIVDGELEVLLAGEVKRFGDGRHRYEVAVAAASGLPSGRFELTRNGRKLRLEWLPAKPAMGGVVRREALLP